MKYLLLLLAISAITFIATPAKAQVIGGRVFGPGISVGGPTNRGATDAEIKLQIRNCKKLITKAKDYLEEKNYSRAISVLLSANSIAITKELKETVVDLANDINEIGKKKIVKVNKLVKEGKLIEAAVEYKKISRIFLPLSIGRKARKIHENLIKDSVYKQHVANVKAEKIDAKINKIIALELKKLEKKEQAAKSEQSSSAPKKSNSDSDKSSDNSSNNNQNKSASNSESSNQDSKNSSPAKKAETPDDAEPKIKASLNDSPISIRVQSIKKIPVKSQAKVYKLFKLILKKYPKSKVADTAKADLDQLKSDKKFMSKLKKYFRKQKRIRLYKRAQNYERSGLKEKAISLYQILVKKYPKSKQGKLARKRLKKLGAPVKASK